MKMWKCKSAIIVQKIYLCTSYVNILNHVLMNCNLQIMSWRYLKILYIIDIAVCYEPGPNLL